MTVINNVFYVNPECAGCRVPDTQRFVWAEHGEGFNSLGGVTLYESKEAVEKAWRDVFHIETNSPVRRIYGYDSWVVLLDEHEENIIRRATRMHVEN